MNAQATTSPLAASSADLQTRITAERERLYLEQNLGVSLENQRLAPLEAGDDEALDRVEQQINSCNDRQSRIQERLEILEKRLANALANDEAAHLDTIAARAERAREMGERLITVDYLKAARPLATILERLHTADALIASANDELEAAGRPRIPSPNAIRERLVQDTHWIERRRVPVTDHHHPMYGRVGFGRGNQTAHDLVTKQDIAWFAEVDIELSDVIGPHERTPLYQAIDLPTIEPEPINHRQLPHVAPPMPIWKATDTLRDVDAGKVEALIAELDTATTRSKK